MTRARASRRVLITGAASGIGLATAQQLAARGDRVWLVDLSADALAAAAASMAGEQIAGSSVVDVTDAAATRAAVDAAAAAMGGIDAVVHSAGILRTGTFDDLDLDAQLAVVKVNLGGTIIVAHAALPHLRTARGSLVMMGSASAFHGPPEFATYGATKAAVLSLGQALRIELEGSGVAVSVCNPLFVSSPMVGGANADAALLKADGISHTPDEIATAIVRAIDTRRFNIIPSWRPRRMWVLSRYLAFAAHRIMSAVWHRQRRRSPAGSA